MDILVIRGLLFGVPIWAADVWKVPYRGIKSSVSYLKWISIILGYLGKIKARSSDWQIATIAKESQDSKLQCTERQQSNSRRMALLPAFFENR